MKGDGRHDGLSRREMWDVDNVAMILASRSLRVFS